MHTGTAQRVKLIAWLSTNTELLLKKEKNMLNQITKSCTMKCHTRVSSDPDIRSEPFEFQATAFTQPKCPCKS